MTDCSGSSWALPGPQEGLGHPWKKGWQGSLSAALFTPLTLGLSPLRSVT